MSGNKKKVTTKKVVKKDPLLGEEEATEEEVPAEAEEELETVEEDSEEVEADEVEEPEEEDEPEEEKPSTKGLSSRDKLKKKALSLYPNDIVARTKYILENEEQVMFNVPKTSDEPVGAIEVSNINGYKTEVPKGEFVKIPISVAKNIANKHNIGMNAGNTKEIGRAKNVEEALS